MQLLDLIHKHKTNFYFLCFLKNKESHLNKNFKKKMKNSFFEIVFFFEQEFATLTTSLTFFCSAHFFLWIKKMSGAKNARNKQKKGGLCPFFCTASFLPRSFFFCIAKKMHSKKKECKKKRCAADCSFFASIHPRSGGVFFAHFFAEQKKRVQKNEQKKILHFSYFFAPHLFYREPFFFLQSKKNAEQKKKDAKKRMQKKGAKKRVKLKYIKKGENIDFQLCFFLKFLNHIIHKNATRGCSYKF